VRTTLARSILSLLVSLPITSTLWAQPREPITGIVVDSNDRAVGRALVSVTDAHGRTLASTFTGRDGRFSVAVDATPGCRVAASLAGFIPAHSSCEGTKELRLSLAIAPVRDAVVVTATRDETPASQLAASVTVFDRQAIDRRQTPLVADLLRQAPGVTVVHTGALGTQTSLFVRGGESNYNKVLLDGIPLNEPGGVFYFNNVTSENLERVELVRGSQSALFGSDAMASVVQMFTRRASRDGVEGGGLFEAGGYGTARGSVAVAGKGGAFDYSLDAARYATDNRVPNNEFDNTTLSGSAGLALPAGASLRFVGRGEFGEVGTPGQTAFGRPDLDARFERRDGVAGVTFTQRLSDRLHHRAVYGLALSNQESTNLVVDPPYTPSFEGRTAPFEFSDFPFHLRTELRRHHLSYQVDWRVPAAGRAGTHLVTGAIDFDGERATLLDRQAGSSIRARRNNAGYSLQHQGLWPRVFTTVGVRIEDNDSFGVSAVPRGSVAWIARQRSGAIGDTKLKASAGLGIKEPTIQQSFNPPPFSGNPDLEPERARSVDAGVEQRFLNDRAKVEVTWFANRFRNIISTRTVSFNPFRSQYFNIGLTRARGAELTIDLAPAPTLRIATGYTFLASEILDSTAPTNPVFSPGQWLFRRPRHSGFTAVTWHHDRLLLDLSGIFVGRRVDSDFSSLSPAIVESEAYALWDLRGQYRLSRQLSLIGAIDNLTDSDYMEPPGYLALGRTARLGVKVGF
jgi:outer membrane cobalamin receptor